MIKVSPCAPHDGSVPATSSRAHPRRVPRCAHGRLLCHGLHLSSLFVSSTVECPVPCRQHAHGGATASRLCRTRPHSVAACLPPLPLHALFPLPPSIYFSIVSRAVLCVGTQGVRDATLAAGCNQRLCQKLVTPMKHATSPPPVPLPAITSCAPLTCGACVAEGREGRRNGAAPRGGAS